MMTKTRKAATWILSGLLPLVVAGCGGEETVSFSQDVRPILEKNCLGCHVEGGAGYEASGFNMATYEDLMKGTKFGPMIIKNDAEGSNLVVLMEGRADPSISMPHGSMNKVSSAETKTIRAWIDQGAKNN